VSGQVEDAASVWVNYEAEKVSWDECVQTRHTVIKQ
jgi:hypothetical protein